MGTEAIDKPMDLMNADEDIVLFEIGFETGWSTEIPPYLAAVAVSQSTLCVGKTLLHKTSNTVDLERMILGDEKSPNGQYHFVFDAAAASIHNQDGEQVNWHQSTKYKKIQLTEAGILQLVTEFKDNEGQQVSYAMCDDLSTGLSRRLLSL